MRLVRIYLVALMATLLIIAMAGTNTVGALEFDDCVTEADKFAEHPHGGPRGVSDANPGLANAEAHAEPGGESLAETVTSDAGDGNGSECGDPGNSGGNNNAGD